MDSDGLKKFLQAAGTIAEMTRVYYDNYLRVGFTAAQALQLANNMTIAQLQMASLSPPKEEEI